MKPFNLNTASLFLSENFKEFQQFLKSTSFSRAVLVGIAVTLPIIIGLQLGYFEIGLALCFGAFWSSPSDVSGSFHHKRTGILMSAALVMTVSLIGGYMHYETWISLPILGILGFAIAFISVYGFRASLISFSGLLALVLSFANDSEEMEIYQYALLIGVGGLWYLFLTKIWHHLNPKAETEEILVETFIGTAEFLETRGKLIGFQKDRNELQSKLYQLQSELTEQHGTLREILILSRKSSGQSHYHDKRLLVFIQLVEMLETAIANPVNYDKMDTLWDAHPEFAISFQNLIFEMANQLRMVANVIDAPKKLPKNVQLEACYEKLQNDISAFTLKNTTNNYEDFLMLLNLLEYQKKQFEKLKRIKWLLGNPDKAAKEFIDRDASKRFIVSQDYDPKLLVRNFSFRSTIFRHSLRLAVTLMIGYTLGNLFPFQNPYWILLTIIVIMRPSYGLTKTRSKDRIIGTLIGGAIAVGMVFLIQNPYVYGALGVISLVIAFSMVQKNYKASATFITLSVIFIYAILQPDVLTVIQFRILDTVVGAGLSYAAIRLLWPAWEFVDIKESILQSVSANHNFFLEITGYYQQKGSIPTSYNIARKEAFLETSNLSSAFQRMAQEPKSKQRNIDKIYELVVLNHTFVCSCHSPKLLGS
ncbi:MAG: FUSC family membrane protein [Gelidibacter sp.]